MNLPIVTVEKQLYRPKTDTQAAPIAHRHYTGPNGEMSELNSEEARDDVPSNLRVRFSADHGRTWSSFHPLPPSETLYNGVEVIQHEYGPQFYNDHAGVLVELWLRQIHSGGAWDTSTPILDGVWNQFTYTRLSRDHGRTWSAPRQLRYEPGADFDPADPLKPAFLQANQAFWGNNIIRHSNGTLITCGCHANAPGDPQNHTRPWKLGSLCFIGHWNKVQQDYDWDAGERVEISPDWSSRGLSEPEVAELTDGRVLVVWRGSSTPSTPGRKWFSLSTDGGRTLSPVAEWKYADGTSFYSPASYHRMVRHSQTGKLYWMGNITPEPAQGSLPRYPLVIAEVDEAQAALKRETVTVIDTKQHGQGDNIQFSNFLPHENRETHAIEFFLTTYGQEPPPADWRVADCWHYRLRLLDM